MKKEIFLILVSFFNFIELKLKADRNTILHKIWNYFLNSTSIEFSTNFVVNLKLIQQLSTAIFFISNITKFQIDLFFNFCLLRNTFHVIQTVVRITSTSNIFFYVAVIFLFLKRSNQLSSSFFSIRR